jgi:hypothetical protein
MDVAFALEDRSRVLRDLGRIGTLCRRGDRRLCVDFVIRHV